MASFLGKTPSTPTAPASDVPTPLTTALATDPGSAIPTMWKTIFVRVVSHYVLANKSLFEHVVYKSLVVKKLCFVFNRKMSTFPTQTNWWAETGAGSSLVAFAARSATWTTTRWRESSSRRRWTPCWGCPPLTFVRWPRSTRKSPAAEVSSSSLPMAWTSRPLIQRCFPSGDNLFSWKRPNDKFSPQATSTKSTRNFARSSKPWPASSTLPDASDSRKNKSDYSKFHRLELHNDFDLLLIGLFMSLNLDFG